MKNKLLVLFLLITVFLPSKTYAEITCPVDTYGENAQKSVAGHFEEIDNNCYYIKESNSEKYSGYLVIDDDRYYFSNRDGKLLLDTSGINSLFEGDNTISYESFYELTSGPYRDYDAIYMTHDLANWEKYYGHVSNPTVKCGANRKEYVIDEMKQTIKVATNVNWEGCNITFDDTKAEKINGVERIGIPIMVVVNKMFLITESSSITISPENVLSGLNQDWSLKNGDVINIAKYSKRISETLRSLKQTDLADNQQKYLDSIKSALGEADKYLVTAVSYTTGDQETSFRRFVRTGGNVNSGVYWEDSFVIDKNGNILTDSIVDFKSIDELYIRPIYNEQLTINGGNFTTKTNNTVYKRENGECKKNYYVERNIRVLNSNVTIKNLNHFLDESTPNNNSDGCQNDLNGNIYTGFIDSRYNYNFKLENVLLTRHTITTYNSVINGTYDLNLKWLLNASMINVRTVNNAIDSNNIEYKPQISSTDSIDSIETIYNDIVRYENANGGNGRKENLVIGRTKWSASGINDVKDLLIKNSIGVEANVHENGYNVTVENSILNTIITQGSGTLKINNSIIYDLYNRNYAVQLRADYGGSWEGNIIIKNSKFISDYLENNSLISIVSSEYYYEARTGRKENYGYDLYFPNITVDGLVIKANNNTQNVYVLTINEGYTACGYEETKMKHHFNDSIILNNISVERTNANLNLFSNQFYNPNPSNCNLNGYYCQNRYNNNSNEKTHIKIFDSAAISVNNSNISCVESSEQFVIKHPTSIKVNNNLPNKTNYVKDHDNLDLTGGKISLNYSDGTSELINMTDSNVIASNFDNSKLGANTITLNYFGLTTTFNVNIVEDTNSGNGSTPEYACYVCRSDNSERFWGISAPNNGNCASEYVIDTSINKNECITNPFTGNKGLLIVTLSLLFITILILATFKRTNDINNII